MYTALQLFCQFYDWLKEIKRGEDILSWTRETWLAVLHAFHVVKGQYLALDMVPQYLEYHKERRLLEALRKEVPFGGNEVPSIDRHSPVSNGHVYCPEEACEYPVTVTQDGSAYCQGCSAYVGSSSSMDEHALGEEEYEEENLSILVKESNGVVHRVVIC